jgi:hypothetical protein
VTAHLYADACLNSRCLDPQTFHLDTEWRRFDVSFLAPGSANAGLDIFVTQPGTVWIDDVSLRRGDTTLYRRDFDNGIVLLNYTNRPQMVNLGGTYRRLSIPGSTVWDGASVEHELVPPYDARILLRPTKNTALPMPSKALGTRFRVEPNPCPQGTAMRFAMSQDEGPAQLAIFDVSGRRVRTLADGARQPSSELIWNGEDESGHPVAPGVYFARLQTPARSESHKITLLR